jgi:hypothetical protein
MVAIRINDAAGRFERDAQAHGRLQKLIVALTSFFGTSAVTFGMPDRARFSSVLVELLTQPATATTARRSSVSLIFTHDILLRSQSLSNVA